MKTLSETGDYLRLVLERRPIIDVRAPIEFLRGSTPQSVNLPLMADEERAAVGTTYKQLGRDDAIALGNQLVAGEIKKERLAAWQTFANKHPNAVIMCARGGMRSTIVQNWLYAHAGIALPKVTGGFKALRQFYMKQFDPPAWRQPLVLVAGHTGAGKTKLIEKLPSSIDLEGIANHRGSSFGNYVDKQPTQINFENALSEATIALRHAQPRAIVIEKEGKNIGKNRLPQGLIDRMNSATVVVVTADIQTRVANTWREYVVEDLAAYRQHYGTDGKTMWLNHLEDSLLKLKRRLGAERTAHALALLKAATRSADLDDYKPLIEFLLIHYYDPMYSYQKQRWTQSVMFEGSFNDVLNYLTQRD